MAGRPPAWRRGVSSSSISSVVSLWSVGIGDHSSGHVPCHLHLRARPLGPCCAPVRALRIRQRISLTTGTLPFTLESSTRMAARGTGATHEAIRKPRGGWSVAPNLVDYEAERARFSWEACAKPARWPARRPRPEHRPRSRRPARGRAVARPPRDPLARQGRRSPGSHVRRPPGSDEPIRERAAIVGCRKGRPRVRAARTRAGAVRRRARHAEEPQRVLPAVLGVRPRTDPRAHDHRTGERARHDAAALSAQGRRDSRAASRSSARADRRRRSRDRRTCPTPTTTRR